MKRKKIWIAIGALCAVAVLLLAQISPKTVETAAWGLHFGGEGKAPTGPAGQSQLRALDAAYMGSGDQKVLYLTFDAGYENGYTEKILEILEKHQVPAAFFLVGDYLERNADIVRKMVEAGHIVGNHTATHPDMSKITEEQAFRRELSQVEDLFKDITGKELPRFYRPPQGVYSEENLKMAKNAGYKTVFWSLAYADWDNNKQPTAEYAMSKLLSRTHNGAVILLHATSRTNGEILDRLLTEWKAQGYTFASIDKLF